MKIELNEHGRLSNPVFEFSSRDFLVKLEKWTNCKYITDTGNEGQFMSTDVGLVFHHISSEDLVLLYYSSDLSGEE